MLAAPATAQQKDKTYYWAVAVTTDIDLRQLPQLVRKWAWGAAVGDELEWVHATARIRCEEVTYSDYRVLHADPIPGTPAIAGAPHRRQVRDCIVWPSDHTPPRNYGSNLPGKSPCFAVIQMTHPHGFWFYVWNGVREDLEAFKSEITQRFREGETRDTGWSLEKFQCVPGH